MAQGLEHWLDRHMKVAPDEFEISDEGWQRLGSPMAGEVAVPAGVIRDGRKPNEYRVLEHDEAFSAAVFMSEGEIDRKMTTADARFLGQRGHRYDTTFHELRHPGVQSRYERVHRRAVRIKGLATLAGAAAVGAVWAAAHLPVPRLVGEDNCFDAVPNRDQVIKLAGDVQPKVRERALQQGQTCELGEHKYVIESLKAIRKHKPGIGKAFPAPPGKHHKQPKQHHRQKNH